MNSKSAVITGSSRGIGEAIAVEFATAGYNFDTAAREFGTIDVLVNNAGINGPEKNSPEITTKEWEF